MLVMGTPEPFSCPQYPSSISPSWLPTSLLSTWITAPSSIDSLLLKASVLPVFVREALVSKTLLVALDSVVNFLDLSVLEVL